MTGVVIAIWICIAAMLLLFSMLIYRYIQNNQDKIFNIKKRKHLKKLERYCCICSKKVPKNNRCTIFLTDHKFSQTSCLHTYHPLCVKKVLEYPEEYAEKDPMIVKAAIVCYDRMKTLEETKRDNFKKREREREEVIIEAKTRNLDFFLEESKGSDFK
jgi:hypothetical protein